MNAPRSAPETTVNEPVATPIADTLEADGLSCGRLEPLIAQRANTVLPTLDIFPYRNV
jgi:hypothetical protein